MSIINSISEKFWIGFEEDRKKIQINDQSPLEITIKPEIIDISNLKSSEPIKHFWRPEKFEEYIGQENLKLILQSYLKGCQEINKPFPHTLISGMAGSGKTTIIYLISKYLNINFVECVANTINSPQQFIDKLVEVNGGVLFLDELQVINKKIANFILPILEDFQINGTQIKPFTFCGATTELGILLKKFKPLVDRMKILKQLEPYKINELIILTKQYKEKNFPKKAIDENIYSIIANNCRKTPRIAIRLLESYIFMNQSIESVLHAYNIIKHSITLDDIRILKILNEKQNGLGLKALASFLGTSEENYLYQIESYLLQEELITIGSRRTITNKGKEFLKCL